MSNFFGRISAAVGHITAVLELQRHYMREKGSTSSVNIRNLVDDAIAMLYGSLAKRNVRIQINTDGRSHCVLRRPDPAHPGFP